mgnify:CR=1 FL=1
MTVTFKDIQNAQSAIQDSIIRTPTINTFTPIWTHFQNRKKPVKPVTLKLPLTVKQCLVLGNTEEHPNSCPSTQKHYGSVLWNVLCPLKSLHRHKRVPVLVPGQRTTTRKISTKPINKDSKDIPFPNKVHSNTRPPPGTILRKHHGAIVTIPNTPSLPLRPLLLPLPLPLPVPIQLQTPKQTWRKQAQEPPNNWKKHGRGTPMRRRNTTMPSTAEGVAMTTVLLLPPRTRAAEVTIPASTVILRGLSNSSKNNKRTIRNRLPINWICRGAKRNTWFRRTKWSMSIPCIILQTNPPRNNRACKNLWEAVIRSKLNWKALPLWRTVYF